MTIGVIGAMQMEVDDLKAQMTDTQTEVYSGVEFVEGKIGDQYVVAAKCGIGKVFAAICAEAMILKYDVDMIVNIGVAGTLTKDLNVLDVAVATNVLQHDMDTSPIGDPKGLLSGINMILNTFDAIAAEMEGGSIGHVCYVNKVPFAILRSISDGDGGETDYQTFAEKAAHQSIEVVLEFIGRAEELK